MALYLVIQIGAVLSRYIPRSWRYLIGTAVGDIVYVVWSAKRHVLQDNTATVLGLSRQDARVRRMARKSMRNYCKYLIEFLELPVLTRDDPAVAGLIIRGAEHLHRGVAAGKGVILASGHFGTIELAGMRLQDFTGDFHVVYDQFKPAYLDRLIESKRRDKRMNPIPATNVRAMLRALKGGGVLAVLFDKPVESAKGVPVRFFGRETAIPGGPALLAMKTGAAILPVYTVRQPDKTFESVIYPPITYIASGDREKDMQAIMQKLMDSLQHAVRERADQWYMFRPMWPDQRRPVASSTRGTAIDESRM